MENFPKVIQVSECFIKPNPENQPNHCYLAPNDIALISGFYMQMGLLYTKPSDIETFLDKLKGSLSQTLVHFYPLAGQLETQIINGDHGDRNSGLMIFIDCCKGHGVRFVHAKLDATNNEIVSPIDVPQIVQSFFDHDRALIHAHLDRPLLSIQVTELIDGIFIGCSVNHAVCDGTSFWHFWNIWFRLHILDHQPIPNPPVHNHWFPGGCGPQIALPFTHPDEFLKTHESPPKPVRQRIFHFSPESIQKLKTRANAEARGETEGNPSPTVSAFQALCALVWISITRARQLSPATKTTCNLDASLRHRLDPPLPNEYFGNSVWVATAESTAGELLERGLGPAARLLNRAVAELTDGKMRGLFEEWVQSPFVYQSDNLFESNRVVIGNSPRFNVYGNEFGLGKPVAVRSGYARVYSGKVTTYPGFEGGGSVDLEICLLPKAMAALEQDDEFMAAVTPR